MSFDLPTLTTLIARAKADYDGKLPGADSRLRRSVLDVLSRVHAGALKGAYGMLDDISHFLPDDPKIDPARLARWAAIFGLTRKAAEAASGTVDLAGTNGVPIPAGTVLARRDGERYVVTADVTIAGGVAAAAVTAEGAGTAPGMATGQQLEFVSPIAGVAAVGTVAAPGLVGGVEEENDEELRGRLLLRIRNPVRGGSASDYVVWATEVAEVTRAWVYPNWNGLGTVKVLFVMDGRNDIIPEAGDEAVVAAYIQARRPVCADVTVAGPVDSPLNYTITPVPDTPEVRAAIAAELDDLHAREAEPGGTLLISHIREAISIAAGETDHTLTLPNANVTAAAGEIKTRGTITWPS